MLPIRAPLSMMLTLTVALEGGMAGGRGEEEEEDGSGIVGIWRLWWLVRMGPFV